MKAVVDTGPLLFLSKISRLGILRKFGTIFVPKSVVHEIKSKQDDAAETIVEALDDWLKIEAAEDRNLLNVLSKELDEGEAEVICLAIEQKIDWIVMDDHDARRFARRQGMNVIGTLGLLAWAKKKGLLENFLAEAEKLRTNGFYATYELIERLSKEVGEV